jgi:hypothetical protein
MTELHSHSSEFVERHGDDDFKLIHGIGPGIESRLHAAGIHSYAQLAALTPEQMAAQVGNLIGMSAARVVQQDWIGQARQLAAESNAAEIDLAVPNSHQHYGSFSIELLLDKNNNVRRTKVLHIQSLAEDTWAGWEEARLLKFISKNAALNILAQQAASISELMQETEQPEPTEVLVQKLAPAVTDVAGQMRLAGTAVKVADDTGGQRFVYSNQLFNINLTLDLVDLQAPRDVPLGYSAIVYAKKVGGGSRQMVGSSEGTLLPADRVSLDVKGIQLSSGVYRIETFVELKPPVKIAKPDQGLMAMTEGSLLHII